MTDSPKDPPADEPDASQLLSQAREALEAIRLLRAQADEHLKQTEISRKNADSEALLAFNAKKACEDHATTVANFKGTVEAEANTIATNKQRSDEILAALNTGKASVDADIKAIEGRRKEVDQAAIDIVKAAESSSSRSKEVEASREAAEQQLKTASDSAKSASEAATATTSTQKNAEISSAEATRLLASISEQHKTTTQVVADTQTLLAKARTVETNLEEVFQRLAKSDETAKGYEHHVEVTDKELRELFARVEGLLPGATSAGLASAFNKQRSRFTGPQTQWLFTFIACIAVLVVVALPSFFRAIWPLPDSSWNAAWLSLVERLPVVLPVIWLGIYAGRNYMMSLRMEEDYAYKEAISTAFEGYRREMEKIAASGGENPTPITILCTNILRAIAERPGRIYEGKQQDINLMSELQGLAEKSAELSKRKLAKL